MREARATGGARLRAPLLAVLCGLFVLLATANSGGYRFGVADQAFYEPAVEWRLHPELFPRDRALLASQAKLTLVDETLSTAARVTGLSLPSLFLALYVVSLVALCCGALLVSDALAFSPWATTAFLALLTLRHRIAKTGANTLEGYMHPRQLAFGFGLIALGCALKRRWPLAAVAWIVAAAMHPTTAGWFAIFIAGGAIAASIVRVTLAHVVGVTALVILGTMAGTHAGPLLHLPASMFMDLDWMRAFDAKDYVFVSQWPWWAWAANLAYLPLLCVLHRRREALGVAAPVEAWVIAGGALLVLAFAALALVSEARVAVAVQLQSSRIFWWLDVIVTAYLAWWLTSDPALVRATRAWVPRIVVAVVGLVAVGRGVYTVGEGGPDRRLFRMALPDDNWTRAMQWLRTQPSDWLVLADPDHAWKYGTSVRVAASRDVVLESVKDSAISLYSRDIAMRTVERTRTLGTFSTMTAADAQRIARQYGATVLVTEVTTALPLPRLYANTSFAIYDLR